jgi:predicted permease
MRRDRENPARHPAPSWRRYLRFGGARRTDDLEEELEFHLAMRAEDFEARGLAPGQARQAALTRFGPLAAIHRECLSVVHRQEGRVRRAAFLEALEQDLRFAFRMIGRQAGWTAVAVLTLALGIGASTAVFSVVDSLLLHPLAYRDADRVVDAWMSDSASSILVAIGERDAALWRARATTIESLALFSTTEFTLSDEGEPTALAVASIGPDFIGFTGLPARLGRSLTAADTVTGAPLVAMVSERLWRTRYGGTPDVIGRSMHLSGRIYRVIGVADDRMRLPRATLARPDVWLAQQGARAFGGSAVVRLKPGVELTAAARELQAISRAGGGNDASGFRVRLRRLDEQISFRSSLYVLSVAVALLLLAACANVAHLLLARSTARARELAVRTALGASRARILRQLLVESLVLTTLGSGLGIGLSVIGVRALVALRPASLTALDLTELGSRAIVLAVLMSVAAGIVFALIAAAHAFAQLRSHALGPSSGLTGGDIARSHRARGALVVAEMALSAMLLLGATLVVRGVMRLQRVDRGFDARNLYSISLRLPRARYPSPASRHAFANLIADRARALPRVTGVTLASGSPAQPAGIMLADVEGEGGNFAKMTGGYVYQSIVSPDFFSVAGITLRDGHPFQDGAGVRQDVIVSEGLAQRLWPGRPAIGRRMRFRNGGGSTSIEPWSIVVGVAANIPVNGLTEDSRAPIAYYAPPRDWSPGTIIVRGANGADLTSALHAIVPSLDGSLVAPAVVTGEALMLNSIASQRFMMTLLGVFAAATALLAGIGLFGVISYAVAQRRREIGIRMALGATPGAVGLRIAGAALTLSVIGLGAGILLGLWATNLVEHSVFGMEATDPTSVALSAALLVGVAITGSVMPVWRAMRIDPVAAIRAV